MSKIPTIIFLLCLTLVCSFPVEERSALRGITRGNGQRITIFDEDRKEFSNSIEDETVKSIETSGDTNLFSGDIGKRHFFNGLLTGSKGHAVGDDWWVGGIGTYSHKPSGSGLFFKANRTNSGLGLQGKGLVNIRDHHSLFSSFDLENKPGSLSSGGAIGYSHTPTGSQVSLTANKNSLGTDLTLSGQTDALSNKEHRFRSLFTASRNLEQGTSAFATNFNYTHNPSGKALTFGSKYSNDGLLLNGRGNWKFNDNHSLSGSVIGQQHSGGRWGGTGTLDYQHKPTDSRVSLGFGNNGDGTNIFLKGQRSFGSNGDHSLQATGLINQAAGSPTSFGGMLDYHHKPSNSNFGLGVQGNVERPELKANGNVNFKNGAKLGLGGHFYRGPKSSSAGFQISGAF